MSCPSVLEIGVDQRENAGSSSIGEVKESVGVRSIWKAWTPGSTEESTCVARIWTLSFGYTTIILNFQRIIKNKITIMAM